MLDSATRRTEMSYPNSGLKTKRLWVDKEHRTCDKCSRQFLSGTFRIARGRSYQALCLTCDDATPRG